jgi:hypothetical protein
MWYKPTDIQTKDWISTWVIDAEGFMCKCDRDGDMAVHKPSGHVFTPKWIWV